MLFSLSTGESEVTNHRQSIDGHCCRCMHAARAVDFPRASSLIFFAPPSLHSLTINHRGHERILNFNHEKVAPVAPVMCKFLIFTNHDALTRSCTEVKIFIRLEITGKEQVNFHHRDHHRRRRPLPPPAAAASASLSDANRVISSPPPVPSRPTQRRHLIPRYHLSLPPSVAPSARARARASFSRLLLH